MNRHRDIQHRRLSPRLNGQIEDLRGEIDGAFGRDGGVFGIQQHHAAGRQTSLDVDHGGDAVHNRPFFLAREKRAEHGSGAADDGIERLGFQSAIIRKQLDIAIELGRQGGDRIAAAAQICTQFDFALEQVGDIGLG